MRVFTVSGASYEEALAKARSQYGAAVRIHSRKDLISSKLFVRRKNVQVELVCYVLESEAQFPWLPTAATQTDEGEAVEATSEAEEPLEEQLFAQARLLLEQNGFTSSFVEKVLALLSDDVGVFTEQAFHLYEFELMLIDKIVSLLPARSSLQLHNAQVTLVIGHSGSEKLAAAKNICELYESTTSEPTHLLELDLRHKSRLAYTEGKEIYFTSTKDLIAALSTYPVTDRFVINVTVHHKNQETLQAVRSELEQLDYESILSVSAMTKISDIKTLIEAYRVIAVDSLMVTQADETETIGELVSLCVEEQLPLAFISSSSAGERTFQSADSAAVLHLLRNFSVDFGSLWSTE